MSSRCAPTKCAASPHPRAWLDRIDSVQWQEKSALSSRSGSARARAVQCRHGRNADKKLTRRSYSSVGTAARSPIAGASWIGDEPRSNERQESTETLLSLQLTSLVLAFPLSHEHQSANSSRNRTPSARAASITACLRVGQRHTDGCQCCACHSSHSDGERRSDLRVSNDSSRHWSAAPSLNWPPVAAAFHSHRHRPREATATGARHRQSRHTLPAATWPTSKDGGQCNEQRLRPPSSERWEWSLTVPSRFFAVLQTNAVQALVSRSSCSLATEAHVSSLSATLNDTDVLMASLVDGMCRLDQVLWEAAKPAALPGGEHAHTAHTHARSASAPVHTAAGLTHTGSLAGTAHHTRRTGGWVALKPAYRALLAQQAKSKQPNHFKAGMMRSFIAQHERHPTASNVPAGAAAAPSVQGHYAPSSTHLSLLLTPTHASLNRPSVAGGAGSGTLSLASSDGSTDGAQLSTPASVVSQQNAPMMFSPATPQQPANGWLHGHSHSSPPSHVH